MSFLYTTYKEYARVQEELSLTEEGIFIKGKEPDNYGGPILNFWQTHIIHMVDSSGQMQTLEFHNAPPLNKDKSTKVGLIKIDGQTPVAPALGAVTANGGDARTWVTKMSTTLPATLKALADKTFAIRTSDASIPGATGNRV